MNATARFYLGLAIVVAIVVSVSFALGYRAGFSHAIRVGAGAPSRGPHRMTAVPAPSP